MTKEAEKENKISGSLGKLEQIVAWFEQQEEVDVELGLLKVKEGAALIKELKEKLKKVENEFEEIKKDLGEE
ncbi:MAG: exodeoxyribonuclease VII small subunit [Candidatus Liptonbacteria bacterium]|nr:exodeoxyribonuclease VII small subunit [Candidatus Liptonbacteria bacterium]